MKREDKQAESSTLSAHRIGALVVRRLKLTLLCLIICALNPITPVSAQSSQSRLNIEGVVTDQSGAPVANALVSLNVSSSVAAETRTDARGRFILENVTASEGLLVVRAKSFAVAHLTWRAHAAATALIEIVLQPEPITEQVTVTATRTETTVGDTPSSILVLSSSELATTAAVTVDDALKQVAGFQLFRRTGSRAANPTAQGVSLRGAGASGASRALVLLDGIPLNDPFGGWVYWGRVPRESISRVEVLRGGASNLYGSGAMGGVAQILTRDANAPEFSLETSYGNERTADASAFAGARRGAWAAKLGVDLFRTDGYVLVDERERGSVDTPANSRHATFDLTLERYLKKRGRVFASGAYFSEARGNGTPLQTNKTRIRQLSAGGDYQSEIAGAFSLRAYFDTQVYDQIFSAVMTDRNSETLTRLQRVPAQATGFSFQWSKPIGAGQTIVAGADALEVRGSSDELAYVQGRPSSFISAGGREGTFAIFAEDIARVTRRLIVTGGIRFDRWRNFNASSTTQSVRPGSPAAVTRFQDRSETALSPQASLLYRLGERWSLAASAYRAFRAPTLNELYRSFRVGDVLTLANDQLRAERLTGGEAGANFNTLDRKLAVRGTFYWTEINRPVANVTLSTTPALITRQRQNLGRTRSRGVEIEWDARINRRWSLSGGYAMADARVIRFPANSSLEGLMIPQVARHQLSFQIRYLNPSRLSLGIQGRASGSQFDDDQNLFRLAPYFTLDALVSRPIGHSLDAFIAAENLFNRRYEVGRTPVTTLGPPILVRAGIRLHLGAK